MIHPPKHPPTPLFGITEHFTSILCWKSDFRMRFLFLVHSTFLHCPLVTDRHSSTSKPNTIFKPFNNRRYKIMIKGFCCNYGASMYQDVQFSVSRKFTLTFKFLVGLFGKLFGSNEITPLI